ncbi:protein adenylyltransferase SelO [Mucilaginibacter sp. PAMB04168]|uniref:protein adenylyltransferase SelO n=1 Tax=Mucilaginibacter sp. PAMB04168 TaxID=3138567 RepID=UPI0031F6B8D8
MQHLSSDVFKYAFVSTFPGDDSGSLKPRQTPGVLYSKTMPTPVNKPVLLAWSPELAAELGIAMPAEGDINLLGGNLVTPSMQPYALCYAGHQFGNWAGQLGDGRAICLGEWETPAGDAWEIQLKGAGRTAYSRRGDGRAVLRSSLREYLMSEAMHYLGVPTTRALSLVGTGDQIVRDMFYDGRPAYEPGAIVARVAPSFLRFGNFEILAARNEIESLTNLVNWTIERYYPHIEGDDKVLKWFGEVIERTATMIVEWLRVGFVHGVMNTDNMSVLGLTIDYGPFSFLDNYDPNFTPNTTDLPGRRYAFGQQANIAYWNLSCLANALVPMFPDTDQLAEQLKTYEDIYWSKYYAMMASKLGLDSVRKEDVTLFQNIEEMLTSIQPDMTIFYQLLIDLPLDTSDKDTIVNHFRDSFYDALSAAGSEQLYSVITNYIIRRKTNAGSDEDTRLSMMKSNPRFILRNYLLHQAIEELEKGNNELFLKLQEAIKDPYSKRFDEFYEIRPGWATQMAGCSMLSCSS